MMKLLQRKSAAFNRLPAGRDVIFSPPKYADDIKVNRWIKPFWPPRWGWCSWVAGKGCGCQSSAPSSSQSSTPVVCCGVDGINLHATVSGSCATALHISGTVVATKTATGHWTATWTSSVNPHPVTTALFVCNSTVGQVCFPKALWSVSWSGVCGGAVSGCDNNTLKGCTSSNAPQTGCTITVVCSPFSVTFFNPTDVSCCGATNSITFVLTL